MQWLVLSLLFAAAVAPVCVRVARPWTGWLLALCPLGILVWSLSHWKNVTSLFPYRDSFAWAPSLGVHATFHLDGLALLFLWLICGMGALVLIYAGEYMRTDERLGRFYAYLLLFMSAMVGLVLADNVFTLFVFWELTSVSSFLLIGWNHHRAEARKASLTALLVTGGGGLMMLAGLALLALVGGQTNISQLDGDAIRGSAMYVPILLLTFAGAATKSAQAPFHFWLPGAMAAPTPVSAYLHSATMVKAGIYLLARLHPTLGHTDLWQFLLIGFGGVTMITAAFSAVTQKDLKLILAYSTVSVLGALTMLLGIGTHDAIRAAIVYLVAHSLYKGALFLGAGTLDHETGTRDITQLRGLARLMPISATAAVIAAASNAGMIPLFGFIAKELFYGAVMHAPVWPSILMSVTLVASTLLVIVGFMVAYRPYFGGPPLAPHHPHEAPPALWIGAVVLAVLSLVLGLFPALFAGVIGSAAASAVNGSQLPMELHLWHGFNPILELSALTVCLGASLFFLLRAHQQGLSKTAHGIAAVGPQRVYDALFAALMRSAEGLARMVQNRYLRNYVLTIVIATIGLVAVPIIKTFPYLRAIEPGDLRLSDIVVGVLILVGAVAAIRIRSRLAVVAILGAIGVLVMSVYVIFGAMDLALTQIMVEALTVILLVLVIYHLPRFMPSSSRGVLIRDAVVSLVFGGMMSILVLMSATLYPNTAMREYFVEHSYTLGHGRNIVNVILVDFRAMDTLGEITVLSVAGIGVYALLMIRIKKEK